LPTPAFYYISMMGMLLDENKLLEEAHEVY